MPRKDTSLGKSLIRAYKKKSFVVVKDGYKHSSDIPVDRDLDQLNLKSVTEQTSLEDFLDRTALAQNEYMSESDSKIVEGGFSNGLLSEEEKAIIASAQDEHKELLSIPRRPFWDSNTSKEKLDALEKESFLAWRHKLALLREEEHINLTPYEKNLEVWRQLWRVIERSDLIVQILDARNPLLFRCLDLESYVKEVDERKSNALLLNKADFLTEDQRKCWCDYFDKAGIQIVFFSALEQMNRSSEDDDSTLHNDVNTLNDNLYSEVKNNPKILSREELISFLKTAPQYRSNENVTTVGMVGYPNVGKSSTINAVLMCKKVSVSATPGKTKHFQTLNIEKDLCLCDCPGLVFPNFVSTKAEMVINGMLPIDQLTDSIGPTSLVTSMIPKKVLESTYSIFIKTPGEGRHADSPPTAEEFLEAHGYNRGYMTHHGLPDKARSARYILKDFVNGKLLYCHAPPDMKQEEYYQFPDVKSKKTPSTVKAVEEEADTEEKKAIRLTQADKKFFVKSHEIHTKGKDQNVSFDFKATGKPWKKHNNANKKQKVRLKYGKNPYEDC